MLYKISHTTCYTYSQPVLLKPHTLRLRPRCDGRQHLHSFALVVDPEPAGMSHMADLDGNSLTQLWFTAVTEQLRLTITAQVETYQTNPFDYILEPWTVKLPLDYPSSLLTQLSPYLHPYSVVVDSVALELAQEIAQAVNGDTMAFLSSLNQRLYESCDYLTRETGAPWPAGVTWRRQQGSCRDLAVLFMDSCRAMGLAARFVSGYQEGDLNQERRDLHAWAEVYLPGAGWRGYDPTHGLAVADRHIVLAASPLPSYTAAVSGSITPVKSFAEGSKMAESQMEAHISIQAHPGQKNEHSKSPL